MIIRSTCLLLLPLALAAAPEGDPMPGKLVETDPDSGAQLVLLGEDERPADNIYGEQPYGDASGRWIAVRYYAKGAKRQGLSVVDLKEGSRRDVIAGQAPFPAFHAWGEYLYYHPWINGRLVLRRTRYDTLKTEDVAPLPTNMYNFSYGTVSPDSRYYAVSVQEKKGDPSKVHLLDLQTGQWRLLLDKPGFHSKHEQFSLDGRNRILVQLNQVPELKQVLLGELEIGGETRLFPADRPYTPKPTGHEAWIGTTDRIFFSTAAERNHPGNVWSAKVGEDHAVRAGAHAVWFGHISVSRCGRYWVGDTGEKGVPIYIGSFASGRCKRAVFSRTMNDGKQWSHTHPYLTADNRWLILTSSCDGRPQVYGARLAPGWLEGL